MLTAYLEVLEARGWLRLPTRDTGNLSFFAHGAYLLDRIQVFQGRWTHQHFDGTSWLTDAKAPATMPPVSTPISGSTSAQVADDPLVGVRLRRLVRAPEPQEDPAEAFLRGG